MRHYQRGVGQLHGKRDSISGGRKARGFDSD
jgi:hypothetical protein